MENLSVVLGQIRDLYCLKNHIRSKNPIYIKFIVEDTENLVISIKAKGFPSRVFIKWNMHELLFEFLNEFYMNQLSQALMYYLKTNHGKN